MNNKGGIQIRLILSSKKFKSYKRNINYNCLKYRNSWAKKEK